MEELRGLLADGHKVYAQVSLVSGFVLDEYRVMQVAHDYLRLEGSRIVPWHAVAHILYRAA